MSKKIFMSKKTFVFLVSGLVVILGFSIALAAGPSLESGKNLTIPTGSTIIFSGSPIRYLDRTNYDGNAATATYATSAGTATSATSAGTANALAANGANCSAGYYPLGVDASGAAEGCTLAASGAVTGSGTANYVSKWTSSSAQGNGIIYDNGTNVGIGLTSSNYKFVVSDNVNGFAIQTSGTSPNAGIIRFGDNSGWKLHFGRSKESSAGAFNTGTTGVVMTIQDNGYVGIGTTAPNNLLGVYQLIDFNNTDFNTKLGYLAGNNIVTGAQYNTFVGNQAGTSASSGSTNAADANTAVGYLSFNNNTTGSSNSALGSRALNSNTTGYFNSGFGVSALEGNTTGNNNTAVGSSALASSQMTGSYDVAVGNSVLLGNSTGSYNSGFGASVLRSNSTGSSNTAIGYQSMTANLTGSNNTAVGYDSGRKDSSGSANETSSNSVYLGYDTRSSASGNTNEIVIGYSALGVGSNSVVLGNDSITTTMLKGNVGIGTGPSYKLHVAGNVGATSFVYTSDRSLKKNIKTLDSSLNKILQLRGVSFNWKKDNTPGIGLIAQEVEKVYPDLVSTGGDGIKAVQYGNLVAPLIEAIKEQQKKIDQLETRIAILEMSK